MNAKDRIGFIGGSDVAAALGLSRYKTQLALWSEKTGLIDPEDISDKLPVRLGNKLEATVCELFEEETGKKVQRVNEPFVHPKFPFLRGMIDRRVVAEKAIVEAKAVSPWRKDEFDADEMPTDYYLQVLFYLALTGAQVGYLAVLIGNQDFKIHKITRDEEAIRQMIDKLVYFWREFVVKGVMPHVTKKDAETLYALFPEGDDGEPIALGEEANALADTLGALNLDKKNLDGEIERVKNELKVLLKERTCGTTDRYRISWLNIDAKAYEVAAKKYRKLDVRKIKGA